MYFNQSFEIDGVLIGAGQPPYIIAEMSANHGNDINQAISIVREAKKAGAHAIKLQTYRADTLTLNAKNEHFYIKEGPWKGQYLYDLYEDASMPWEWTEKLQAVAKEEGITLFSSPFDISSVAFLETLNMPAYKIASAELMDLPFVRRVAQTKKPIIMSTGFATLSEINAACNVLIEEGVKDVCILKCTSEYPAPAKRINLKTIPHMKESFHCPVGLSDHTLGNAVPIASVAFGVSVIEKHFILNRDNKTADSFFSATPQELKILVDSVQTAYEAIGEVTYPIKPMPSQRSLIVIKDIKQGAPFQEGVNIKSLRPGGGVNPSEIANVINRKAVRDINRGTLLQWNLIGELNE